MGAKKNPTAQTTKPTTATSSNESESKQKKETKQYDPLEDQVTNIHRNQSLFLKDFFLKNSQTKRVRIKRIFPKTKYSKSSRNSSPTWNRNIYRDSAGTNLTEVGLDKRIGFQIEFYQKSWSWKELEC